MYTHTYEMYYVGIFILFHLEQICCLETTYKTRSYLANGIKSKWHHLYTQAIKCLKSWLTFPSKFHLYCLRKNYVKADSRF